MPLSISRGALGTTGGPGSRRFEVIAPAVPVPAPVPGGGIPEERGETPPDGQQVIARYVRSAFRIRQFTDRRQIQTRFTQAGPHSGRASEAAPPDPARRTLRSSGVAGVAAAHVLPHAGGWVNAPHSPGPR